MTKGVFMIWVAGAALAGCSADIFDVEVQLAQQRFGANFGSQSATIPVAACDPGDPGACGTDASVDIMGNVGDAHVTFGCDAAAATCFATADARVAVTMDVLRDENFETAVKRRSIAFVRLVDVAYVVPANTLTFDIPQIDIYVGPAGTTRETDEGVVPVDSIHPVPAGTVVAEDDPRHLVIADRSEARSLIERSIQQKQPFVFVSAFAPRLSSGDPIPGGAVELALRPRVRIGFPR